MILFLHNSFRRIYVVPENLNHNTCSVAFKKGLTFLTLFFKI